MFYSTWNEYGNDVSKIFKNKKNLTEFEFINIDNSLDIDSENIINIDKINEFKKITEKLFNIYHDCEEVSNNENLEILFNTIFKDAFYANNIDKKYTFDKFNDLMISSKYYIFDMRGYYVDGIPFIFAHEIIELYEILEKKINEYKIALKKEKNEKCVKAGIALALLYIFE
tara:strand:+ start:2526 stop:3038 length:513 start_codon:yes stop_codon:yes gene_type:complete